ncbi:hypothetical protein ACIBCN_05980 [Nocardia sp. NPDC051052]|uniref:hypothetical protein n=1 Tax=Nocardia sp. NPDC051052 TaxID=3364322 RepID=UPI003795E66E
MRRATDIRTLTFGEYGPPDVLEVTDISEPLAAAGHIRVSVRASGLTPSDCHPRAGRFRQMRLREQLADAETWAERFALTKSFFAQAHLCRDVSIFADRTPGALHADNLPVIALERYRAWGTFFQSPRRPIGR